MKLMRVLLLFAALIFTTNAMALAVGDDAPSLGSPNWVMNEPENFNGDNLKGQVTFVELWGVN